MSDTKPNETVVLINKFFANEQGRDKFNKVIQFADAGLVSCLLCVGSDGSRLMMYHLLSQDPKSDWGKRFKAMFVLTRDCRKILRLFKWVGEYEKLERLLAKPSVPGSHAVHIQIIGVFGMAAYWFFDNLTFLVKGGMLTHDERYGKLSMLGWNIGITCAMIIDTQTLLDNFHRETQLRAALGLPAKEVIDLDRLRAAIQPSKQISTPSTIGAPTTTTSTSVAQPTSTGTVDDLTNKQRQELIQLYTARLNLLLSFIKNGGDWIISANGSDMIQNVLGYSLNDGIVGIAGVGSGLATMIQVVRGL